MTLNEKFAIIAENQKKVYDAGRAAERKSFFNAYQKQGKETYYTYHFAGNGWTDDLYHPLYDITATANASCMFYSSWISDTKVDIYLDGGNVNNIFYNSKLVTIRKLHVTKDTLFNSNCFQLCKALVNIEIVGSLDNSVLNFADSKKLSKKSFESIVHAFGGTGRLTFSKVAVDKAFETSAGANDGSSSYEWLLLASWNPYLTISII